MKTFSEFISEGLFSRKSKVKIDNNIKSILRIVTDIIGSWEIEKGILIGDGTDMKKVAEADLERLLKHFPEVDFKLFKENSYYTIRATASEENLAVIKKKGYR